MEAAPNPEPNFYTLDCRYGEDKVTYGGLNRVEKRFSHSPGWVLYPAFDKAPDGITLLNA